MKRLNLVYPDKGQIKFNHIVFPDGQQNIIIKDDPYCNIATLKTNTHCIEILSRLNNFQDLEVIICAVKSLNKLGVNNISLYIPYFLGSRSDRTFELGGNNYLKDVICPIINSLNLSQITIVDPHSDVLESCLNNYHKIDNSELIQFALNDLNLDTNCVNLLSPDAGALKKIYDVGQKFDIDNIVTASKIRENGKIIKTEIPAYDFYHNPVLVIDDICDGGKTFIEIGKALSNTNCAEKYLIITHGIFSKGFEELEKHFDGIYCTNSYSDLGAITQLINIKQLNIF